MTDQNVPTTSIDRHYQQVTFDLLPEDIDRIADWMATNSRTGKTFALATLLITWCLIGLLAALFSWWSAALGAVVASFLIICTLARGRGSFWKSAALATRKVMRKRLASSIGQARTVRVDENVRIIRQDGTESSSAWSDVDACDMTKQAIFVLSRKNLAAYIPIRAFPDADAAKSFYETCCANARAAQIDRSLKTALPETLSTPGSASGNSAPGDPILHYRQDPQRNRLALLSLITGFVSLGLICFGPLALLIGLVAMSLGTLSEFLADSTRPKSWLGRWGVILGTFSFLNGLIVVAIWGFLMVSVPTLLFRSVATFAKSAVPFVEVTHKVSRTMDAAAIAQACRGYSAGHDSHFPPHLAVLLIDRICTGDQIHAPDSASPPLPAVMPPYESDWPLIRSAVDASSDFIYVGGDITESASEKRLADKLIVVFTKDMFDSTGRAIGFADGNARFVETADIAKATADCNSARAALGLPPIEIK